MPILMPMNTTPPPPTPASTTLAALAVGSNSVDPGFFGSPMGTPIGDPRFFVSQPTAQAYVPPVLNTSIALPQPLAPVTTLNAPAPPAARPSSTTPTTPPVDRTPSSNNNSSSGGGGDSLWDRITNTGAVGAARTALHWWLGGLGGEHGDNGAGNTESTINDHYRTILSQYGAPEDFIRQAQNQFHLAWQIQGGEDGLDEATINQLAGDVLNGMIGEWQRQQAGVSNDPFGDARQQLEQDRQAQMAQVAATQAWMQPMMEQQLTRANQDAGAYTQAGLALAGQVSNPAVSAALSQLARSYSSDQSVANAVMMQQAQLTGQNTQAQMTQEYSDALSQLAQQESQYDQEFYAANGYYPGQPPIIGGLPLAPVPADTTQVPGGGFVPGSTVSNYPVVSAGAGPAPAAPPVDANTLTTMQGSAPAAPAPAAVPTTGTTTTMPADANTLTTMQGSVPPPPSAHDAITAVLSNGPIAGVDGQQVNVNEMWQQVLSAGGQSSPTTDYYASRLAAAAGITPQAVLQYAQQQTAQQGSWQPWGNGSPWVGSPVNGGPPQPSLGPTTPTTTPVNGAEAPAAPTAVGPAADITQMFDSWGPTYARQWYTVNASSLSQSEREHAETWLRRHPQTTTATGTTVPIQQLPPVTAPLAPVAPVNTSAPSTTIPQ